MFHDDGSCLLRRLRVQVLAKLNPRATRNQHAKNAPYDRIPDTGWARKRARVVRRPARPRPDPRAKI